MVYSCLLQSFSGTKEYDYTRHVFFGSIEISF